MLEYTAEQFRAEAAGAETVDLLDRVTAYRAGLEPTAVAEFERELHQRGISAAEIAAHAEACVRNCIFDASGTALPCSRCRRPAVMVARRWHRLWGVLPLFPRAVRLCRAHGAAQ